MRTVSALAAAVIAAILLLELLTPSAARLFPRASPGSVHFFAVGIGLLLGLIGHFLADLLDRRLFEALYGPRGRWRAASRRPVGVFPAGDALARARDLAVQALPKRPDADDRIEREVAKIARRQVERWERIERPLILARCVRGVLWPALFVGAIAGGGALAASVLGAAAEVSPLLLVGMGCLALGAIVLVPYSRWRTEYLLRLYDDVAAHAHVHAHTPKKKSERR
jgi:hypothetical protein